MRDVISFLYQLLLDVGEFVVQQFVALVLLFGLLIFFVDVLGYMALAPAFGEVSEVHTINVKLEAELLTEVFHND